MELQFLHYSFVSFSVQNHLNNIRVGCIYDVPEVIFVGVEVDHFGTSVHDTGNMIFFSQIAGLLLTQIGALFNADFNCLHCATQN